MLRGVLVAMDTNPEYDISESFQTAFLMKNSIGESIVLCDSEYLQLRLLGSVGENDWKTR
jgi:hypothetical protein